jgi:hypothetical protein
MDEHPGIVFRDGPTGRRAALPRGPDVWELVWTLREFSSGDEPKAISAAADLLSLSESEVRIAARYYAAFSDDIDDRIARNLDGADEAEAIWRREQAALA